MPAIRAHLTKEKEFTRLRDELSRQRRELPWDIPVGTYNFLDLVPKGRDEDGLAFTMSWVRHHDRYKEGYLVDAAQLYSAPSKS